MQDAINWLKENGRLPSFTTEEYFKEIQMLKKTKEGNEVLKEKNTALQAALRSMTNEILRLSQPAKVESE